MKDAGRNVSSGGRTPRKGARTDVRIGRINAKIDVNMPKNGVKTDATMSRTDERIGAKTFLRDEMAGATECRADVKTDKDEPSRGASADPVVAANKHF